MAAPFEGPMQGAWPALLLISLLVIACVADLRTRRIPNALVLTIAVLGVLVSAIHSGIVAGGGRALVGIAVGLAIWLPFWLFRMLGGGDVKLFAAGAAWLGASGALEGALLAALCGGLLSFVYLLMQYGISHTSVRLLHGIRDPQLLRETVPSKWDRRMPYGLAMSAGILIAAWRPGILI